MAQGPVLQILLVLMLKMVHLIGCFALVNDALFCTNVIYEKLVVALLQMKILLGLAS